MKNGDDAGELVGIILGGRGLMVCDEEVLKLLGQMKGEGAAGLYGTLLEHLP